MKKIIVCFSLLLSAGLSAIASDPEYPSQFVLNEFKKEFSSAQQVIWDKQDEFDKATFVLAGQRVVAYFNVQGQLEGTARDIFYNQLPLAVMTAVEKRFQNAEIINVLEITNSEGTSYRITMEEQKKKWRFRVSSGGGIEELKKLTK